MMNYLFFRLPASYVFQPTAYGGSPLLSLPATTASPALAAALASASGNPAGVSQFYEYQPANLTASGVGGHGGAGNAAAAAAAAAFSNQQAAHFAATQAAFANDPYASYLAAAAASGQQHHGAATAAHNAAAAYAAYLPQVAANAMPAGGGAAGTPSQGNYMNPYAVATDGRMQ